MGSLQVSLIICLISNPLYPMNVEEINDDNDYNNDQSKFQANGPTWAEEPFPRDANFYPMTFIFGNRFKSESANR